MPPHYGPAQADLNGPGIVAPALLLALIHRSAWNRNSPKFVVTEFSEVVAPGSQLCYLVCKRFGGERVGQGEEKACDE
jgi:hypothetical protein